MHAANLQNSAVVILLPCRLADRDANCCSHNVYHHPVMLKMQRRRRGSHLPTRSRLIAYIRRKFPSVILSRFRAFVRHFVE